jgi:hypothetical protein
MSGYGDKPFGLRDVKFTDITGSTQVDLPVARTLSLKERLRTGELSGDDQLQAVVAFSEAVEWSLEEGGISLEAYALITGRTVSTAGSSPSETTTLTVDGAETFPYFKIYGKSIGDGDDDVHVKLFKAKVTGGLEGTLQDGSFFVTKCSGIAVDDGVNGIMDIVQNETADDLPAT